MTFKIYTGTKSRPDPITKVVMPFSIFTVIETKGTNVIQRRDFDDLSSAQDYIQSALEMDRNFAIES